MAMQPYHSPNAMSFGRIGPLPATGQNSLQNVRPQNQGMTQQQYVDQFLGDMGYHARNPTLAPNPVRHDAEVYAPQLPQAMAPEQLMAMFGGVQPMQYGAQYWQSPGPQMQPFSQPPQNAPAPQPAPQQANVSTGINPGPVPAAPVQPQQAVRGPFSGSAAQAGFQAAAEPGYTEMLGQHAMGAAGANQAIQQAQSKAGLGWGGLGSQDYRQGLGNDLAYQQMLQRFLAGWMG